MKQISLRVDEDDLKKVLDIDIDKRQSSAIQAVMSIYNSIRRATRNELNGIFTRQELITLLDATNGTMPVWQYIANREMFIFHIEDAEKYQNSASMHGTDLPELCKKLERLTTAQVAVLQIELHVFWHHRSSDMQGFLNEFL